MTGSGKLRNRLRAIRNARSIRRNGFFSYFGHEVYATPDSEIVRRIGNETIFEIDILQAVLNFLRPNSCFMDVGANIGVMSIPVLSRRPDVQVLAVECSPSTLPLLKRTHEAAANPRWQLDGRAVSGDEGIVDFYTAGPGNGAFDGLRNTKRGGSVEKVEVEAASLDRIWRDHGKPPVSVLKIDIEGAEFGAIMSGAQMIETHLPAIIFEWSRDNLPAFDRDPQTLFQLQARFPGELIALPSLLVPTPGNLGLLMRECEMFVLLPNGRSESAAHA